MEEILHQVIDGYDLQGFNQGGAGFLHISSFRPYMHLCPEKIFSRGWVTRHQG
jgi:hypothetical protein